jgi:hypothetical protein
LGDRAARASGPQVGKEAGPRRGKRERVAGLGHKREERDRRGILGFFFFSNFFKLLNSFKTSHKQTINTMQPKDDAQALIASKIIKMIFKYLKAKFI